MKTLAIACITSLLMLTACSNGAGPAPTIDGIQEGAESTVEKPSTTVAGGNGGAVGALAGADGSVQVTVTPTTTTVTVSADCTKLYAVCCPALAKKSTTPNAEASCKTALDGLKASQAAADAAKESCTKALASYASINLC